MKKYYWLKIKKDFYKRHDVKIVESMPNGKEYMWFYMKLMMESIDHDGMLRFNDFIPYDAYMLSTITDTNIDIVRGAMSVFQKMNMIEVLDDETIFIEAVTKMIGSESDSAERVRKHREIKSIEIKESKQIEEHKPLTKSQERVIEDIYGKKTLDKIKSKKKRYGKYSNVMLTEAEKKRLESDYPKVDINALIEWFDAYIEEKAYKSKSHNLSIRRWVIDAYSKPKQMNKSGRVETVTDYKNDSVEMSEEELLDLEKQLKELKI